MYDLFQHRYNLNQKNDIIKTALDKDETIIICAGSKLPVVAGLIYEQL
jgi:hypothetical protein